MSTDAWKSLARFTFLLGFFGVLCGLLVRQRGLLIEKERQEKEQARRLIVPLPVADDGSGIQFGLAIDPLSEQLLKAVRAKRAEVLDFRKQRRGEIVWSGLLVPADVDMWTETRVTEEKLRFRLRELDAYRRLTKDTGEARVAGERFVEAYLRHAAAHRDAPRDFPRLQTLGKAAIEAGSRDPLVRTYFAFADREVNSDLESAAKIWTEVLTELPGTGYPKGLEFYATSYLYGSLDQNNKTDAVRLWRQTVLAAVHWLEEESENPEWIRSVYSRLWILWENALIHDRAILLSACMQSNKVDPYFIHSLAGDYFISLAWQYRGGKYYSELSVQQSTLFTKYIRFASEHLQYAWKLRPDLPYAPARMITVSMAGPDAVERPYFWFVQTVHAQFDYYSAYTALLDSLLPRWGGTHPEIIEFASNCLATNRFVTCVPYFAIDSLQTMEKMESIAIADNPPGLQLLGDFVTARNKYRAAHPDEHLYDHDGSYMVGLIELLRDCHRLDDVADVFRSVGQNINWTYLRKNLLPARYLAARLLAGSSEDRARFTAFDENLRQPWDSTKGMDDLAKLTTEYQELKDRTARDENRSTDFYRHVDVIIKQLREFSAGDWVPLPPGEDLAGWEPYCDRWNVLDDNRVELSGQLGDAHQVCLRPLANFHPPLEIEANLELVLPPLRQTGKDAGICWSLEGKQERISYPANQRVSETPGDLPVFEVNAMSYVNAATKEKAYYDRAYIHAGKHFRGGSHRLRSTGSHRLRLKLWKNHAEFRVDESTWMTVALPEGVRPDSYLCFGEYYPRGDESVRGPDSGVMRWSGIRVKRLDLSEPPAETDALEHRIEYWERRFSEDEEDVVTAVQLCILRYQQRRYDDLLTFANKILEKAPDIKGVHKWKGLALFEHFHDYAAALTELRMAADEPSDEPAIWSPIAEILAAAPDGSLRNGAQAKSLAVRMVRNAREKHARSLAALAAAHAEVEEFDEAIIRQKAAMLLADESEQKDWEPRLAIYESHQPFRLPGRSMSDTSN